MHAGLLHVLREQQWVRIEEERPSREQEVHIVSRHGQIGDEDREKEMGRTIP